MGRRLSKVPAECRECGFVFRKRDRLTAPSRCPVCKGEAISDPSFRVGTFWAQRNGCVFDRRRSISIVLDRFRPGSFQHNPKVSFQYIFHSRGARTFDPGPLSWFPGCGGMILKEAGISKEEGLQALKEAGKTVYG